MKPFTLEVITQEKHLLTETVTSLTINTQVGELTILSDHLPLFVRLNPGEMAYVTSGQKHFFAITGGFMDVSPRNIVTVLADSAIRSEEINLEEAEAAIAAAKKALLESKDEKTNLKIELELRNAILQANLAKKHKKSRS